jgi:hypothetical protein
VAEAAKTTSFRSTVRSKFDSDLAAAVSVALAVRRAPPVDSLAVETAVASRAAILEMLRLSNRTRSYKFAASEF